MTKTGRAFQRLGAENAELRAKLEAQRAVVGLTMQYVWDLDAGFDVLASESLERLRAAVFAIDKKMEGKVPK